MPHHLRRSKRNRKPPTKLGISKPRRWSREEKKKLAQRILGEIVGSHERWYGLRYPDLKLVIDRRHLHVQEWQRFHVQQLGESFGCHTCRTYLDTDKNQPWIGDHIPPTELKCRDLVAKELGWKTDVQELFPQCDECAFQQAALVKRLNGYSKQEALRRAKLLVGTERKLIFGGLDPIANQNCVRATGSKVSSTQGRTIQTMGTRNGCHSCGSAYPRKIYIADHVVPKEFCTNYMPQVFKILKIDEVDWDSLELRPQCPRCSHLQGGNMSGITKKALELAESEGLIVYK